MERMNQPSGEKTSVWAAGIEAIAKSLRHDGTPVQRVLCALMMALLALPALPGGYYCCQTAMFAVLIRLGLCVPAAFAGMLAGFAVQYAQGNLIACWQLPAGAALWLSCGLWAKRTDRRTMAAAVFPAVLSCAAVADVRSPIQAAALLTTAALGAGLTLLYDGAALCAAHRDELDGDTRPLCTAAVCASLAAALFRLPFGGALALAFCAYLTVEHAYAGGGAQSVLCSGVLGGVLSLSMLSAQPCAMLLCGGFLAGEIRTRHRGVSVLLMLLGMAAAGAVLGEREKTVVMLLCAGAGMLPFLVLSARLRAPVTGLIEHLGDPEVSQSEAIALRMAGMMHAWSRIYADTANMMQGLFVSHEEPALSRRCVSLLHQTSEAAHQVCERTLSQIRPDDEAFRAVRFALVHAGFEEVSPAYALLSSGRLEVMLLKPEGLSPNTLVPLLSRACGMPVRPAAREGLLATQAVFEQTPALSIEVGAALRSRSGEVVAGDGYLSRSLPGGRHLLALSDGMGCGECAMQQSHLALSLLAQCLGAGYTRAQTISVVNSLMLMCTGSELYATLDLCEIDLHTGEAAFDKLGACASFVVRGGEVRAVCADTLPVGTVENVEAASVSMTLSQGDLLVMMTDGVLLSFPGGEEGISAAIASLAWLHPQAVGERLIAQALDGGEATDDMAVLCVKVGRTPA